MLLIRTIELLEKLTILTQIDTKLSEPKLFVISKKKKKSGSRKIRDFELKKSKTKENQLVFY